MDSVKNEVIRLGPKLVPFLKTLVVYFIVFPSNEIPSIIGAILKCLPIISLMLFVILHGMSLEPKYKYARYVLAGLIFCCLGDAFLVWPNYFIPGMIAFAIGHVNYILAFGFKPLNLTLGTAVFALKVAGILYLLPSIQGSVLKFAVPFYALLLGTMMWRASAQLTSLKDLKKINKICSSIGGTLFVLSDLILAINMFKFRINNSQTLIMSSYYTAQFFIALSVVETSDLAVK